MTPWLYSLISVISNYVPVHKTQLLSPSELLNIHTPALQSWSSFSISKGSVQLHHTMWCRMMCPAQQHQDTRCSLADAQPFHSSSPFLQHIRLRKQAAARQFHSTYALCAAVWKWENPLSCYCAPSSPFPKCTSSSFSGEQTICD